MFPVIAALNYRRHDTTFDADFTSHAVGADTSLTAFGLSYERLSAQYSVQSSETTVITGGDLNNSNTPAFGKLLAANFTGLLIEEGRANRWEQARDETTAPPWGAGTGGTATDDAAAGPDGVTSASQLTATSGTYPRVAGTSLTSARWTASVWHKEGSGGALGQVMFDTSVAGDGQIIVYSGTEPSVWTRSHYTTVNTTVSYAFYLADGRNHTSLGGIAAGARDSLFDLVQLEMGRWPSEVILSTGTADTARAAPRLWKVVGNSVPASDGSIRFYAECYMKGSSAGYTSPLTLWFVDSNNKAEIDNTSLQVKVTIGGTTYSTPQVMSWSRGDLVRVWCAAGGGTNPCEVKYSVNASSPITLSTGSPSTLGVVTVSSTIDFLQANKVNVLSAFVPYIRTYKLDKKPSGF